MPGTGPKLRRAFMYTGTQKGRRVTAGPREREQGDPAPRHRVVAAGAGSCFHATQQEAAWRRDREGREEACSRSCSSQTIRISWCISRPGMSFSIHRSTTSSTVDLHKSCSRPMLGTLSEFIRMLSPSPERQVLVRTSLQLLRCIRQT